MVTSTHLEGPDYVEPEAAGAGWLFFAGTILGLSGIMRIIDALWTFNYHGQLPENLQGGVFGTELETYGWIWLFVGIVLLASSVCVVARIQVARWVGIAAAVVSALGATAWLPYFPIWSLTYITLAVLVIYALSRYGGHHPRP